MKFKIETNGHTFRVLFKRKWWPFWEYVRGQGFSYYEFSSKEEAERIINEWKITKLPWGEA